jgi:polar amino acid transport system substrate-binding protein
MKLKHGIVLLIVSLSLFSSILTINAHAKTQADDTLAQIKSKGYITVGADTTYPPFESINATTNMPQGFDVDLSLLIGHALGVDVHYVTSAWDPIIPNLQQKQFDIILSAMTITTARAQEVDFSRWYYISSQAWLVPKDNPKNILTESDLNQTGLRIGYQTGTTSDLFVNESLPDAQGHGYADVPLAITDLKAGNLDVVLGDWAVLLDAVNRDNTLAVPGTFSPENFGVAVRKGDSSLLTEINKVFDGLLGTNQSDPVPTDQYNGLYYKWFGLNAPGYTGSVTTASLPTDVTLKYDQGSSSPGFEIFSIFVVLMIPVVRKFKKQNKIKK